MRPTVSAFGLFRVGLGLYLLDYYRTLLPDFLRYFGPSSMIQPQLLSPRLSFLFWCWTPAWLLSFFALLIVLIVCFMIGWHPRRILLPLWLLHLGFHHANPLIIHEPQQLANLFLLCGFFLPIDAPPAFSQRRGRYPAWSPPKDAQAVATTLTWFLGIYYFVSALKKLPDPLWRSGAAMHALLQWPALAKPTPLTSAILSMPLLSTALTYATLAFELGFVFLVFTRARPLLILAGVLFHALISATMEVGGFAQVMMVWYALLLDEETRSWFWRRLSRGCPGQHNTGGEPGSPPSWRPVS
jgi:hypothetical protein